MVLLSGLGLVVVVILDLRGSVAEQDARAADLALRDAQRGARELRTALRSPAVLERVAVELRFELAEGALVIPPAVGTLEAQEPFAIEGLLDAVAQTKRIAAERAADETAAGLWLGLLDDPTLSPDAQAWIAARVAWAAQRTGDTELRDESLARIAASAPDEVGASVSLLCAQASIPAPAWTTNSLARLATQRSTAVLARLEELGRDVQAEREAHARVNATRRTLRAVQPHASSLASADAPQARATTESLLLYYPEAAAGAWLSIDALEALVASLITRAPGAGPPLDLGGSFTRDAEPGDLELFDGLAYLHPRVQLAGGLAAGAGGLALLSVALAALCGGGALLALRAARREAQAARVRSEFLTGVTHELKTPLAGIRLTADLLLDGHVKEEPAKRKHLTRLAGEALRLGVLIDNVLDLGRLERGERGFHTERADLTELVTETLALFEPLAVRGGVALQFEHYGDAISADVDRDALRQALLNILDNARKYAGDGERLDVRLQLAQPATGSAAEVQLAVRDFGPGLDPREREAVFERFQRGARQQDGSVPGIGLGLYLARELLRRHGGDLICTDPEDGAGGACFTMTWPQFAAGERT